MVKISYPFKVSPQLLQNTLCMISTPLILEQDGTLHMAMLGVMFYS